MAIGYQLGHLLGCDLDDNGFFGLGPGLQLRFSRMGALADPSRLWSFLCGNKSPLLVDVDTFAGTSDGEFLYFRRILGNDNPHLGYPARIIGEAADASGCQSCCRVDYADIRVYILLVYYSRFGFNAAKRPAQTDAVVTIPERVRPDSRQREPFIRMDARIIDRRSFSSTGGWPTAVSGMPSSRPSPAVTGSSPVTPLIRASGLFAFQTLSSF